MTYGKIPQFSEYPAIYSNAGIPFWNRPHDAYIIYSIMILNDIHFIVDNYGNLLRSSNGGYSFILERKGFIQPLSNACIDAIQINILSKSHIQLPNFKETLSIYMELEEAKKEIERLKKCEVELNLLKFCENSVEKEEIKQDLELLQFDTTNTLVSSSEDLL